MQQNLGTVHMKGQHKKSEAVLFLARYATEDARLASSFQKLPRNLPKAPHRYLWRNRKRASNALHGPEHKAVDAARLCMRAAIKTGDRHIIEATALDIAGYADDFKQATLADYERWANGMPKPSFPVAGIEAVKALASAMPVVVDALVARSPSAAESAIEYARSACNTLDTFAASARRYARNHPVIPAFR
jgi:hypothetical protein